MTPALAAAANEPVIGSRVAGFELTRLVSRHPLASVYEAMRGATRAAVKLYRPSIGADHQRITREEHVQRQLAHPCVARLLASELRDDGSVALVSEWIEGVSLEAELEVLGPMPWSRARTVVRDVARGLAAIHAAKIVHRDLKPSNIILRGTPSAVIIDFGHALVVDDARLTRSGLVIGSAHYMAPEQTQGAAIDHRVDLYALGVVLYRMLTGVLPFEHVSPAEVMRKHQQDPVPLPRSRTTSEIPSAAEDLCMWLLAKDPMQRVPNAHVLRLMFDALDRARV